MIGALLALLLVALPSVVDAGDYFVYSIYKAIDMGSPGEVAPKDFYVNMGSGQGLQAGSTLEVLRKTATYDLNSQKLYKDVVFPIARLKVIHVEDNASIARLEKILPPETTPVISPRAVMVGDQVRIAH